MGERPLEIIGAIGMNCETIRIVAKFIVGWAAIPPLVLFLPILLVLVPIVELLSSTSCEEFKDNCAFILKEYVQLIKSLVFAT